MKIDLRELINGRVEAVPFEIDYDIDIEEFFEATGIIEATPIHSTGKVIMVGSELFLEMNMDGQMIFNCSRCLERVEVNFNKKLNKMLLTEESDDIDTIVIDKNHLDLVETIKEEIILNLPTQVLCSKDCKGLCPICGINLNYETCSCEDEKIDPRFEILDDFFS
ncbi:MAG: YceD family protein [Bacillota bacterium]|nr:YceD family protein [Bacillota bacterium]